MSESRDALVLVLRHKARKPREQARVEARVATRSCCNKFLVSAGSAETHDCPGTAKRRGLCSACASAFDRKLKSLQGQEAIDYEEQAIASGLLLRGQEVREINQLSKLRIG
jgi:hypothetical protein